MSKKSSRFEQWRADAKAVLDESVFRVEGRAGKWQRFVHFWVLVWRSFVRNRCPVRASALAYVTLLSIIPMLAVVMSVTSTFLKQEGEGRIEQFIDHFVSSITPPAMLSTNGVYRETDFARQSGSNFTTNPQSSGSETAGAQSREAESMNNGLSGTNKVVISPLARAPEVVRARKAMAKEIHQYIQNTRSGTLGFTGTILLIFAAISLLSRIETTFNDIWGVAHGRSWFMRIVLYWGVISLAPILLVVALGLATGPQLESTKKLLESLPFVGNFIISFGFQVLPVAVLCVTFGAFYMLMPNAKVQWRAALVGGLVGGLLFHLNNLANVLYVSRVVSNSKIYGSLALVPVFMIGLYFSWVILLFGAQVAYAYQNRASYLEEKQIENINQRGREFVALRLMTLVGQRFQCGATPPTIVELSEQLGVPTRLIRQIMQTLIAARLVVETAGNETAYLPARPMEMITCHDILLAMRATQGQELATRDEPTRTEVYGEFARIQEAERQAAASVTMLALVNRAQNRLGPAPASTGELARLEPSSASQLPSAPR
ncbi:MAG TPA: YhjD/YihY/BrkB family envelope integrity protein [Clostridia bacterium]|nr:YhjD/YihY/BrkB family envelope integrity protein [Clostridia bacterium]